MTVLLAAFAASAFAQNHTSSVLKCGKPDTSQSIEVGDHAGHMLVIEKGSYTVSTGTGPLAGLKSTSYTGADAADVMGTKFQAQGYGVLTMENGHKAYIRFQDTGNVNEKRACLLKVRGSSQAVPASSKD
ncbi:MAG TPA: hypothetical protein VN737_07310 [Bryobacteraceae bacterium]|nr:hypothetical protein [Bryobacteraceae bacterium]